MRPERRLASSPSLRDAHQADSRSEVEGLLFNVADIAAALGRIELS